MQLFPGERTREGPERRENLSVASTAALPLERPALRAARQETWREKRPVVTVPQNPSDDPSRRRRKREESGRAPEGDSEAQRHGISLAGTPEPASAALGAPSLEDWSTSQ